MMTGALIGAGAVLGIIAILVALVIWWLVKRGGLGNG